MDDHKTAIALKEQICEDSRRFLEAALEHKLVDEDELDSYIVKFVIKQLNEINIVRDEKQKIKRLLNGEKSRRKRYLKELDTSPNSSRTWRSLSEDATYSVLHMTGSDALKLEIAEIDIRINNLEETLLSLEKVTCIQIMNESREINPENGQKIPFNNKKDGLFFRLVFHPPEFFNSNELMKNDKIYFSYDFLIYPEISCSHRSQKRHPNKIMLLMYFWLVKRKQITFDKESDFKLFLASFFGLTTHKEIESLDKLLRRLGLPDKLNKNKI